MIISQRISAYLLLLASTFSACSKPPPPPAGEKPTAAAPAASAAPEASAAAPTPTGPSLKIAYSDWPGWVAWEVAIQKGWFKEAGLNVEFKWFDYIPSMDAFTANTVDAVAVTNGDALVTGNGGGKSVCIVANDYSDGNDMIIAKPGIKSVADLKGKTIGVEVGFVDHLLLLSALKANKMTEKDVKIKNVKTDDTPNALKSGAVDAIAAWQPNSRNALKELPGSTAIYTSADAKGLIYDHLCVSPRSLAENRAAWLKVVKIWFRIADYLADPANLDDAAKIMSARVGLTPDEYKGIMKGTHILNAAENLKHYAKGNGLESIYGSSKIVDDFNVKNGVYKAPLKVEEYFDSSLVEEAAKAK